MATDNKHASKEVERKEPPDDDSDDGVKVEYVIPEIPKVKRASIVTNIIWILIFLVGVFGIIRFLENLGKEYVYDGTTGPHGERVETIVVAANHVTNIIGIKGSHNLRFFVSGSPVKNVDACGKVDTIYPHNKSKMLGNCTTEYNFTALHSDCIISDWYDGLVESTPIKTKYVMISILYMLLFTGGIRFLPYLVEWANRKPCLYKDRNKVTFLLIFIGMMALFAYRFLYVFIPDEHYAEAIASFAFMSFWGITLTNGSNSVGIKTTALIISIAFRVAVTRVVNGKINWEVPGAYYAGNNTEKNDGYGFTQKKFEVEIERSAWAQTSEPGILGRVLEFKFYCQFKSGIHEFEETIGGKKFPRFKYYEEMIIEFEGREKGLIDVVIDEVMAKIKDKIQSLTPDELDGKGFKKDVAQQIIKDLQAHFDKEGIPVTVTDGTVGDTDLPKEYYEVLAAERMAHLRQAGESERVKMVGDMLHELGTKLAPELDSRERNKIALVAAGITEMDIDKIEIEMNGSGDIGAIGAMLIDTLARGGRGNRGKVSSKKIKTDPGTTPPKTTT